MDKEDKIKLFHSYGRVFRKLRRFLYTQDKKMNAHPGQSHLMLIINKHPGITQKELSEKNSTQPASITGIIGRMEENGYIERISDSEDKRIMRVYPTDKGKKYAAECQNFMNQLSEKLFETFTKEEIKQLISLVDKMDSNLDK